MKKQEKKLRLTNNLGLAGFNFPKFKEIDLAKDIDFTDSEFPENFKKLYNEYIRLRDENLQVNNKNKLLQRNKKKLIKLNKEYVKYINETNKKIKKFIKGIKTTFINDIVKDVEKIFNKLLKEGFNKLEKEKNELIEKLKLSKNINCVFFKEYKEIREKKFEEFRKDEKEFIFKIFDKDLNKKNVSNSTDVSFYILLYNNPTANIIFGELTPEKFKDNPEDWVRKANNFYDSFKKAGYTKKKSVN